MRNTHLKTVTESNDMNGELTTITPELAKDMIERGREGEVFIRKTIPGYRNRSLSQNRVKKWIQVFRDGEFLDWHCPPIAIHQMGAVLDGQHRLNGIAKSGCTVRARVRYNVTLDEASRFDDGRPRTLADRHAQGGRTNASRVAAVTRAVASSLTNKTIQITKSTSDWLFDESALSEAFAFIMTFGKPHTLSSPVAAALVVAYPTFQNKGVISGFVSGLVHGEGLKRGDPCLLLRNFLLSESGSNQNANKQKELKTYSALFYQYHNRPLNKLMATKAYSDFFIEKCLLLDDFTARGIL